MFTKCIDKIFTTKYEIAWIASGQATLLDYNLVRFYSLKLALYLYADAPNAKPFARLLSRVGGNTLE